MVAWPRWALTSRSGSRFGNIIIILLCAETGDLFRPSGGLAVTHHLTRRPAKGVTVNHTCFRYLFTAAVCRALLALLVCCSTWPFTSPALADEVRLRCVADTNISSHSAERELNYGRAPRLRLKGIEMLALFRFDTQPIQDWTVASARLYLRHAGETRMLKTLGISTVSSPWEEGTGAGERKPGECCFDWAELGGRHWAGARSDFTDVTFLPERSLVSYADIREEGDDWFSVPVDPVLVQAMRWSVSYGMAVSDEKGQTMANNDVYSREQSGSEPYLVVEGRPGRERTEGARGRGGEGATPTLLSAGPDPAHADFKHGAIRVKLPDQGFAYRIRYGPLGGALSHELPRYAIPYPGSGRYAVIRDLLPLLLYRVRVETLASDGSVSATEITTSASTAQRRPPPLRAAAPIQPVPAEPGGSLRVWAYPDTEMASPVTGALLEESSSSQGSFRRSNPVWDGRSIRLRGARGEILGFQLLVEPASPLKGITVQPPRQLLPAGKVALWRPDIWIFRDWYIRDGDWYPDACLPLRGPFDIPAADNGVAGQRNQSLFADLIIPKGLPPGTYRGAFMLSGPGIGPVRVPIQVAVSPLTLPDTLTFQVSLNTYGTLGHLFGIDDRTPAYRALEREYHRLAHLHRATLAILGYSHSGHISTNYAPPLEGEGASIRVGDWAAWDAQFGPYLDGSAFAGLPRSGVPIAHMYLPFSEDWPADIRKHYRYQPTTKEYPAIIAEHAMKAPTIEEALDSTYAAEYAAILRQFAEHLKQKGWTRTRFQFYMNDKHYYKDPKIGGQGTSWWLLDEPNWRDDWLALAYYARMLKATQRAAPGAPIVFREDISRPQWQRDYLDGLVDLMVVSGELFQKGPLLREMQERLGVRLWTYGAANAVHESNVTAEAWAVRAWLAGADGIVPWQTIGTDENYVQPSETALILPGKRFGIQGPIATLRLKALRRAEQDVEYLALYARSGHWDRNQVAAAVGPLLILQGTFAQRGSEDAGTFRFGPLRAASFADLRQAIAHTITGPSSRRPRRVPSR